MIPPEFNRVIKDFIRDIIHTYPELENSLQEDIKQIHANELVPFTDELQKSYLVVYEHVLHILPTKFFDILYEKADLFKEPCLFLPGIDFKTLWNENITEQTKKLAQSKAEKYGYKIVNSELVAKRPVDMINYGFLPSNPQPTRTIKR